jgi:hypothetical protein
MIKQDYFLSGRVKVPGSGYLRRIDAREGFRPVDRGFCTAACDHKILKYFLIYNCIKGLIKILSFAHGIFSAQEINMDIISGNS